jgi:hypothetical protein
MFEAKIPCSFPEAWEEYLEPIPEDERHDLIVAYHKRLNSDDEMTRLTAAKAWSKWEYVAPHLVGSRALRYTDRVPLECLLQGSTLIPNTFPKQPKMIGQSKRFSVSHPRQFIRLSPPVHLQG